VEQLVNLVSSLPLGGGALAAPNGGAELICGPWSRAALFS
jgi:hypothetical protein